MHDIRGLKPADKYKCGVFCLDSNNLLAITYKTVKNIWDEWKEAELSYSQVFR